MKAILIAAALAVPVAANAQDYNNRTGTGTKMNVPSQVPADQQNSSGPEAGTMDRSQSGTLSGAKSGSAIGSDELFSAQRAVDKIHHADKKFIEYGSLARTRGSSEQIRKFGAKLTKDHQKLEDAVLSYAEANRIQLGESESEAKGRSQLGYGGDRADDMTIAGSKQGSTGSTGGGTSTYGTTSDSVAQAGRNDSAGVSGETGAMGGNGRDSDLNGTGGSTQRANDVGQVADSRQGRSGEGASENLSGGTASGDKSSEQKQVELQAKLDELKNLQGAEFDSKFLSNVIDGSQRSLTKLQGWKGQGDKKLNLLLDRAIKVIGDHQKEAQKLQQHIPAA